MGSEKLTLIMRGLLLLCGIGNAVHAFFLVGSPEFYGPATFGAVLMVLGVGKHND